MVLRLKAFKINKDQKIFSTPTTGRRFIVWALWVVHTRAWEPLVSIDFNCISDMTRFIQDKATYSNVGYTIYTYIYLKCRCKRCVHILFLRTIKTTVHIWNAFNRWIEVPITSHYRQFDVIMSTPRRKWVSLCEMLWYRPVQLSEISRAERRRVAVSGDQETAESEEDKEGLKMTREGKEERRVWSCVLSADIRRGWILVSLINRG